MNVWLAFAVVWRSKSALAQGVVVKTNSRDTIYEAGISPTCDESARVVQSEALLATANRVVYSAITSASPHGVNHPISLPFFFKGLNLLVGRTRASFTLFSFDFTLWLV